MNSFPIGSATGKLMMSSQTCCKLESVEGKNINVCLFVYQGESGFIRDGILSYNEDHHERSTNLQFFGGGNGIAILLNVHVHSILYLSKRVVDYYHMVF